MPSTEISSLVDALAQTRSLLLKHGDKFTAQRLHELEASLSEGDTSAIGSAVSEATGGMGSLNDRYLCVENGDTIEPHEVAAVNARLQRLVKEVEQRGRVAAAAYDIRLMR